MKAGCFHPTLKPVDLGRQLLRLVTPPGGVVIDPFAGSGSWGVSAVLEDIDWRGCDLDADHVAIAKARIAHAQEHGEGYIDAAREQEAQRKRADPAVIEERLRKRREKDAELELPGGGTGKQAGLFE